MTAAASRPAPTPPLPPGDAWVFARSIANLDPTPGVARVSNPNRHLAESLAESPAESRLKLWTGHLETLADEDAEAWAEAINAVSPDDPPPDDGWGHPLSSKLLPVEPFPLDIYPYPVIRLIEEGAKAIGCPPDFLALPVLTVAGAAIGRSVSLFLKSNYFATAGIFAVCVGLPGDGKSPAVGFVVNPMTRIDEGHFAKWKADKEVYEAALVRYEAAVKTAKRGRPRREKSEEEVEEDGTPIVSGEDSPTLPPKPVPPILRRNVVADITIEAMDAILEQNPRGLLQVLDEASSLTSSMNQYRGGKGSDRQWYMTTWSGQARTVDRKGNAENVPTRIPHPFLGLIGGMVPDMVGSFGDEKGRHDGFLDRILFAFPDPVPKSGWREEGVSEAVSAFWSEIVAQLQARHLKVENLRCMPHVIRFTPEGYRAWAALVNDHHAEQRSIEFPKSLSGPWAKLEQYAGRIALILHLLDLATDPTANQSTIPDVSARTVQDAGRLLAYLKSHTHRVHDMMKSMARGGEGNDDVQCILKWLHRHQPETFSLRDLNRDLTRTFNKRAHALEEALAWLVGQRVIRLQPPPSTAGKKTPGRSKSSVYSVNPNLYGSRNCQNPGPEQAATQGDDQAVNSGDFATPYDDIEWDASGDDPPAF